jgi:hypothetical protein
MAFFPIPTLHAENPTKQSVSGLMVFWMIVCFPFLGAGQGIGVHVDGLQGGRDLGPNYSYTEDRTLSPRHLLQLPFNCSNLI